jgi:hypothetical protein
MAIGLSRATLPQEFYDRVGSQLLIQPEPPYIYADLILGALSASLVMPDMVGLPGRQIGGQGAPYTKPGEGVYDLGQDQLTKTLFQAQVNFEGETGTSMRFNRPKFTNSTYTDAARRIKPGQTISTTGINVESEQVLLNLHRYAGPYDATAGEVRPYIIEAFDAKMGIHNLVQVAGLHLVRDFHRWMNYQGTALFDLGATTVRPIGMTNDNTPTEKGQFPLDMETLNRTAQNMDDAYLPTLPDGRRVLVLTPTGLKQLRSDPEFLTVAKYNEQTNPLFRRYTALKYVIPEWYVFVSPMLTTTANTSSINVHTGHAIAPGALGIGMGRAPQVRNNTNDNYGESVPVIWLGDFAFSLFDSRFVYKVNFTENAT